MRLKLFILLTFGVLQSSTNFCNETFRKLQHNQSEFVKCAVEHSVPAMVCVNCVAIHEQMKSQYNVLVKNCSQHYISQNRLDLVYNMEHYLDSIWKKGFCDDCFDESGAQSKATETFNREKNAFDDCLNQYPLKPCESCTDKYIELNDFFKEMEKLKKGKVCFDLQDAMNRTRLKWSKELKCCHREFNVTLFLVASAIFCAIPVMFYLGMYGYTRRQERNHELIDSTYGGPANAQISPSTSNASARTTSTREAPINASVNITNSPQSDDEAPLTADNDKLDKQAPANIKNLNDDDTLPSTSHQSNKPLIQL